MVNAIGIAQLLGAVYMKQSKGWVRAGVSDIKSSGRGWSLAYWRAEWAKDRNDRGSRVGDEEQRKRESENGARMQTSRTLARHSSVDGSTINGRARGDQSS